MSDELRELFQLTYDKAFRKGLEQANKEWKLKATELQRHNQTKRILYPICWLFGHKIDPLWRFCKRCKISEERLMSFRGSNYE